MMLMFDVGMEEIDGNRMVAVKKLVEETGAFASVPDGLFVILI